MDWITLKREEIENDRMPPVCVHCGADAKGRQNETFEWSPGWVRWLYYLGYLPGAVAHSAVSRRMRLSLPVCQAHRPEPAPSANDGGGFVLRLLVVLISAALGMGAAYLWASPSPTEEPRMPLAYALPIGAGAGAVLGYALVLLGTALSARPAGKLAVEEITDEGISLVGVHDGFVRAMRDQRQGAGLGTIPLEEGEFPS